MQNKKIKKYVEDNTIDFSLTEEEQETLLGNLNLMKTPEKKRPYKNVLVTVMSMILTCILSVSITYVATNRQHDEITNNFIEMNEKGRKYIKETLPQYNFFNTFTHRSFNGMNVYVYVVTSNNDISIITQYYLKSDTHNNYELDIVIENDNVINCESGFTTYTYSKEETKNITVIDNESVIIYKNY